MGLADVKKGLEKQLKHERAAIEKETTEQREEILAAAKEEIQAYKERVEQHTQEEIYVLERREVASAKLQAKKRVLQAKKELIDQAFESALEHLKKQSEKEREALITRLVAAAQKEIDVHTVYLAPQDQKLLTGYETKTGDITGGVICESKDGTQRIDLSVHALLMRIREQHLKEIAHVLF